MQRCNNKFFSINHSLVFDGTFFYEVVDAGTVRKIHKDKGVVATINMEDRSTPPMYFSSLGLNKDNNLVAHDPYDTAYCLKNSDSMEGTIVPTDKDFEWITVSDGDVDEGILVNGERLYIGALGLLDATTGSILTSDAYVISNYSAHCKIGGPFGLDASSSMYVSKIYKIDLDTLDIAWEASCSACSHTAVGFDGYVYAINEYPLTIHQFDPDTGSNTKSIDISHELSAAAHFLVDKEGSIYILNADFSPDKLIKFDSYGNKQFETASTSGISLRGAV